MRNVAIVGAGMTPFAEHFGLGIKDLVPMAYAAAVAHVDKGIEKSEIQAAWFGNLHPATVSPQACSPTRVGCSTSPSPGLKTRARQAMTRCATRPWRSAPVQVDVALVMGADKTRETSTHSTFWDWMGMARDKAWDYPLGLIAPASFALHVARFMYEYHVRPEHLALVAVKNHHNAVTNPMAHCVSRSLSIRCWPHREWPDRSACSTALRRATAPPR